MKLDSRSVAALDLLGGKTDMIHFDDDLKGFGYRLRAAAGGKVVRSWLVQYRRAGATRRLLLGTGQCAGSRGGTCSSQEGIGQGGPR
jgi:hypothetical protein